MSLLDALKHAGLIDFPAETPRPVADFGDPLKEYQAAWTSTVVIPEHGFGMITVTGNDRAKFLHNFCTQDINGMQPGDFREGFFCNVKGRILAVAVILCDEDCFYVLTDKSRVEFLHQHLDKYVIMEDVKVQIEEAVQPLLIIGQEETVLKGTDQVSLFCSDGDHRSGWMVGASSDLSQLVKGLVEQGAIFVGHAAWEYIRISAPFPKYGIDVSDDNLAQEANRNEQAISFTKGCYLGQEPIARLDAMGHVNRQLEQFTWSEDSEMPPVAGNAVLNEAGEEVGTATSVSQIPNEPRGIVLAMVKVKALGGTLTAANAEGEAVTLQKE